MVDYVSDSKEVALSHNAFNLSHNTYGSCKMIKIYPVFTAVHYPNDIVSLRDTIYMRTMNPLKFPLFSNIFGYIHYFFIPFRLLESDFESFITGFKKDVTPPEAFTDNLPSWNPVAASSVSTEDENGEGTLWDYFGFEIDTDPHGFLPMRAFKRSYNLVWNEYYRNENIQPVVNLDSNYKILNRNWLSDYFTSCLPFQQKGVAPSIPLTGMAKTEFNDVFPDLTLVSSASGVTANNHPLYAYTSNTNDRYYVGTGGRYNINGKALQTSGGSSLPSDYKEKLMTYLKDNSIDLSNLATLTIVDLRRLNALQVWQENSAVGGSRYTENIRTRFGICPRDATLQRPEYLGGIKFLVPFSAVEQSSASTDTSPQGNLVANSTTVAGDEAFKYRCEEHGIILGLLSIMPEPVYAQGIPRWALSRSMYDWFNPEFAFLSEMGVYNGEIALRGDQAANYQIFGYTGNNDERRIRHSYCVGKMRKEFGYSVVQRQFANGNVQLNADFIAGDYNDDIFMVKDTDHFGFNIYHDYVAVMRMPEIAVPKLLG